MHNLKTNFDKILDIIRSFFQDSLDAQGNYYCYPNKPKMSDCEVISLSMLSESIGIDSENYLFGKIKSDHQDDFHKLISRSWFNRRRKRLGDLIAREKSSKICKENFETAPDKGYSAVSISWYFGYKLHLATSVRGVFSSMTKNLFLIYLKNFLNVSKPCSPSIVISKC